MRQRRFAPRSSSTAAISTNSTRLRLAVLEQMLAEQQERIAQQEEEIARLQGGRDGGDTSAQAGDKAARLTSRRSLLRLGGVGAAVGVVAVASNLYGSAQVAHAAGGAGDGTSIIQGTANVNTSQTGTILNAAAASSPTALLYSDNSGSGATDPTQTTGVIGIGPYNTNGLMGIGYGASGYGVWGQSDAGFGVVGESTTGVDVGLFGTGRFQQRLQVSAGAPTTGSYSSGEMVRDVNGELWICLTAGTPGVWARMAHTLTGFCGGAINFLPAPIRVIDTRTGQTPTAPLPTTKAPLMSGQTYTFQITGTTVGSSSVPSGAAGIYANITVVFPTSGGNLIFYAADQAQPQSSTINYSPGSVVGNFSVIALSASGAVKVYVNGPANTDVVVDIAGFIM